MFVVMDGRGVVLVVGFEKRIPFSSSDDEVVLVLPSATDVSTDGEREREKERDCTVQTGLN